jgi:hypothetical protein
MSLNCWYAISGDCPDLGLRPTSPGTRYLKDNDPACDRHLNPARTLKERLRRMLGRDPKSPWRGVVGFSAITEASTGGSVTPITDAAGRSRFGVDLAHVFGRFRIASIESVDVAILVRHVDSPVYAWRFN